jgi:predicted transcriptional regulator
VQAFVRVVHLHRQSFDKGQLARLLAMSPALVEEYLAVYRQHDSPACRERLAEQLQRLTGTLGTAQKAQKGGQ